MNSYSIESTAGVELGIYEARTEGEALDAMAVEAGYKSYSHACATVPGSLIVTKL